MATGRTDYKLTADSSDLRAEVQKAERSVDGLDKAQTNASKSADRLGKQSSSIDKLRKSFSGLGTVVAGLGVGLALRKMVENTARQDAAMAQLNTTLQSTEFAAGKTAQELSATASALQGLTTYGDEAIIEMQALLLTFKDIKGDNFDATTEAVLDMATAMKTDLKSAAIQLGKALNDPTRNLSALTRSGIQFNAVQTETIKAMQAAGDVAGAQAIILKELESQFGGSAETLKTTLGGALKGVSNAWNDLFEAESKTSDAMVDGLNKLEKALSSEGLKNGFAFVIESLTSVVSLTANLASRATEAAGKWLADFIDAARARGNIRDNIDEMGEALERTTKTYKILDDITQENTESTKQATVAIEEEKESLDKLQEITVTATQKTTGLNYAFLDLGLATEKATAAQNPFQQALQGTVERIDEAFSDAWQGAFDSFSDFADGIKDAMKRLLAELAHMLLTRPLIMNIGAAFGLGGAAGAASAASGAAGGLSGFGSLAGLAGSGFGSLMGAYQGAGQFLGSLGLHGPAGAAYNAAGQYGGSLTSSFGNLGLNLGAGFLGNMAGSALFGSTSGVGSAIGGLGGSIFGPIGTGIGSFIGAGIEKGLGNVFGFGGNGGNQAGAAEFNLLTGQTTAYGIGNSFDEANVSASAELAAVLQQFSAILGGSDFSGRIKVGNRSGIKLDGQQYGSPEELFQAVFEEIIAGATNLDAPLRRLIQAFDGSAEEIMVFADAVISMNDVAGINSVTEAIKDFNAEVPTVYEAFTDQTAALSDMIASYDGSAQAAAQLNQALIINKQAAYEMAIAIQAMGAAITASAEEQARYFRESILSPEQLRANRIDERRGLQQSLATMTDPQAIAQASERILELNKLIFDSLGPEAQAAQAEAFATLAEHTAEVTERRLDASLNAMQSAQEDINAKISALLTTAAQTSQQAANTQQNAANTFAQAVYRFTQATAEVNI